MTTAAPGVTTGDPGVATADPGVTTADPGVATADPGVTTADPGVATADPGVTTAASLCDPVCCGNATCTQSGANFSCSCPSGYRGDQCEIGMSVK